jgi:LacI family transcriptional regulator
MSQVTQKDIANALNLSRVTVTKALKDHPDIAFETKLKIKEKARELGYYPDHIARSLSTRRTNIIGVIIPKIAHSFFASSVEHIYKAASSQGFDIIPMISFEDYEVEKRHIESLLSFRVDGLIVDISENITDGQMYEAVQKRGIPLVFFDRALNNPGFNRVVVNDREASFKAVEFAIKQGYKNIAHFAGYHNISIGQDRYLGFCDALRYYGITKKDCWVIEGGFTNESGYCGFKKLLKTGKLPELLFAVNDSVATGIYDAAKEHGIKIPDQLGVIGFGDLEHSQLLDPPLTSVHMPIEQLAKKSVELLVDQILGRESQIPKEIVLQAELKVRNSTKNILD